MGWNHNVHYHDMVIKAIPPQCAKALDLGCGRGLPAQKLAPYCDEVTRIDLDHECLAYAGTARFPFSRPLAGVYYDGGR